MAYTKISDSHPAAAQGVGEERKEQSLFGVIVHSFFIIPFLIAVFCVILFAAVSLLTRENKTAYDYLEDVKIGSLNKRWQSAFELSKMLANPKTTPNEERFNNELISAFENAKHDDQRVRQYLALAMGRTQNNIFFESLTKDIHAEKEDNLYSLIYALGMLKDKRATPILEDYLEHPNSRIRSLTAVALGDLKDDSAVESLKKSLGDSEPNVQWGSALSLAHLNDNSGKDIIMQLFNRNYLAQFEGVDPQEQTYLLLAAIEASSSIYDKDFEAPLKQLAQTDKNMNVRSQALKVLNP